jgi:hypothetical protein
MCEQFRFDGAVWDNDCSETPSQALISDDACTPYVVALEYPYPVNSYRSLCPRSRRVRMKWKKIRNQFYSCIQKKEKNAVFNFFSSLYVRRDVSLILSSCHLKFTTEKAEKHKKEKKFEQNFDVEKW